MVFLALTRNGYESYQSASLKTDDILWLSAEILSIAELVALRELGVNISEFNHVIEPNDKEAISYAVDTIKEHHPHETVWVEA